MNLFRKEGYHYMHIFPSSLIQQQRYRLVILNFLEIEKTVHWSKVKNSIYHHQFLALTSFIIFSLVFRATLFNFSFYFQLIFSLI